MSALLSFWLSMTMIYEHRSSSCLVWFLFRVGHCQLFCSFFLWLGLNFIISSWDTNKSLKMKKKTEKQRKKQQSSRNDGTEGEREKCGWKGREVRWIIIVLKKKRIKWNRRTSKLCCTYVRLLAANFAISEPSGRPMAAFEEAATWWREIQV